MDDLLKLLAPYPGSHRRYAKATPLVVRLAARIDYPGNDDDCWQWRGAIGTDGYGKVWVEGQNRSVHRVVWEHLNGPLPDGLLLDHLCHTRDLACPGGRDDRHRACANPFHSEPTTNKENLLRGRSASALNARKTHCIHGHPFDLLNTGVASDGRFCRTCARRSTRAHRLRKKEGN